MTQTTFVIIRDARTILINCCNKIRREINLAFDCCFIPCIRGSMLDFTSYHMHDQTLLSPISTTPTVDKSGVVRNNCTTCK